MIDLLAGFDPGLIHGGQLDILRATRHMPDDRMGVHYGICRALGLTRARDGLPEHLPCTARLQVAEAAGMDVIWDLCHFDPVSDLLGREHAMRVANAASPARLSLCAMNEPSIVPLLTGGAFSADWAVSRALMTMQVIRDHHPDPVFYSVDVINGGGMEQFACTDRLVASGAISVVGINYYPQHACAPLHVVIRRVWERYHLPVLIAETSWHDGHDAQRERFPQIRTKRDWLVHVMDECMQAIEAGAEINGVCWYPMTDMPSWDEPGVVWSNGFIRQDLGLDQSLVNAIGMGGAW